jgi:hypothetical protein
LYNYVFNIDNKYIFIVNVSILMFDMVMNIDPSFKRVKCPMLLAAIIAKSCFDYCAQKRIEECHKLSKQGVQKIMRAGKLFRQCGGEFLCMLADPSNDQV